MALAGPAGASASTAGSGTEHFQLITASTTPTKAGVILNGAFTTAGVDHISTSNAATSADRFVLPVGLVQPLKPGAK